ncbi:MAG: hypothetical protein LV479_00860 [Methylacidiphilales bacterium]|nr:hypothetical protein [Candidatus Methylacidiphilales bacterium]
MVFLVFGAIGEELPNLLSVLDNPHHPEELVLPPLTWLYRDAFPLNSGRFVVVASMPFYAAVICALLWSFQNNPETAQLKFLEHIFVICLLFAIHFGLNLLALLLPHTLLMGPIASDEPWNFINAIFDIASIILWIGVAVLAVRLILRKRRK